MRPVFVMPGQKREARLRADVPGIHVFSAVIPGSVLQTAPE
jgi:hypothetical protein